MCWGYIWDSCYFWDMWSARNDGTGWREPLTHEAYQMWLHLAKTMRFEFVSRYRVKPSLNTQLRVTCAKGAVNTPHYECTRGTFRPAVGVSSYTAPSRQEGPVLSRCRPRPLLEHMGRLGGSSLRTAAPPPRRCGRKDHSREAPLKGDKQSMHLF